MNTAADEREAELVRLAEEARREKNWKRWGTYLAERQWGTVREDYSADGTCWESFPHDHARSRAYRWGEDGLLGLTDRECRLCFALALWNGRDPILKERLFGLANGEGNHGEDVKECYYYLDATPTCSYAKALYKYPQAEFPYARLIEENRRRSQTESEFELLDTGIFDGGRYFDVTAEYAKASPDDILIRLTVVNRGPEPAMLHLLPTLWFRNTWVWGCRHEGCWIKPRLAFCADGSLLAQHVTLGKFRFVAGVAESAAGNSEHSKAEPPQFLFTENETNSLRLFGVPNATPYVRDAFHEYLIRGQAGAINPRRIGTKAAAYYKLWLPAGGEACVRLRLFTDEEKRSEPTGSAFDETFALRLREADAFYERRGQARLSGEQRRVQRQASAGLLWSRQFYHYVLQDWLDGDPNMPAPPPERKSGRNHDWPQLFSRDVLSMPDKWEYPWFAAWDLAFHMLPMVRLDPDFAKQQLVLLLREWYMHPSGQLPAYEFAFGDVNPPVHAWACWRAYKMSGARGERDRVFLSRCFQKLVINFTWWVNRRDIGGNNLFQGGFLGLDNIGVFDRSKPLPTGGYLEQADGSAWMAFFCATMMAMALELSKDNPATEDMASKFFEHFVAIADAMNSLGGAGLWDEQDGFYYDQLRAGGQTIPLRVRSLVGLVSLLVVEVLEDEEIQRLPGFCKRMKWFLENRRDLAGHISYMNAECGSGLHGRLLLAIPSRPRLERLLRYLFDENEFLSPYGIRSLSRFHCEHPYVFRVNGQEHRVAYDPGESSNRQFGGNSNWRGPVWFPLNYLIIEALERYHHFYGDSLRVEFPTGSGNSINLRQAACELARRLVGLFLPDPEGRRPCHGGERRYAEDPHLRELLLFHEYFHGDTGRGCGASHQTGWTALVTRWLADMPA